MRPCWDLPRLAMLPVLLLVSAPPATAQQLTQWETYTNGEEQEAASAAQELISQLRNDYVNKGKRVFRDAHPRGIGCVAATFTVNKDLPAQFQTGVFAQAGASYDAIIRFSSSLGPVGDHTGDARGFAIKLFGVPGTKLLSDQPNATTVDFLHIDAPFFPAVNTHDFAGIVKIKSNPKSIGSFLLENPIVHALELKNLVALSTANPNNGKSLAERQFYSQVPYLLQGSTINIPTKFTSRPCSAVAHLPLNGSDTELRDDLQYRLNQGPLCYQFAVQFYQPGLKVEDATNVWGENKVPFTNFATITIPQQNFMTDAKLHYCDALSFHPWHTLAQHQPLGNINRARRTIYEAISKYRHEQNNESGLATEPADRKAFDALTDTTYSTWNAVTLPAPASR